MRRLPRPSARIAPRALVTLVASAAVLAGCSGGVASTANGTAVSDQTVSDASVEFTEMTGSPAMLAGVATTLSRADMISAVMAEHGITVTDAQVESRLEAEGTPQPEGGLSEGSYDLWRQIFEFEDAQQLPPEQQQALMADLQGALATTQVEINPRYAMSAQNYPVLPTWIATTPRQSGTAAGIPGAPGQLPAPQQQPAG